eukprot:2048087-Pyramimonas_sp.AAC.1
MITVAARTFSGFPSFRLATLDASHHKVAAAWRSEYTAGCRRRRGGSGLVRKGVERQFLPARGASLVVSAKKQDRIYKDAQPTDLELIPVDEILGSEPWDESEFQDERT